MKQLRIHWICPEPTPYHANFFNELNKESNVTLEVHFLHQSLSEHPWKLKPDMNFRYRFTGLRSGFDLRLFILALDANNRFVVSGWNSAFLILFIFWLAALRRDFVFWSDTPDFSKYRLWLKRILRRIVSKTVFCSARRILGTGRPGVEAFSAMGCPADKILNFPYFAPITDYDPSRKEVPTGDPLVIVSVGRLINQVKGFDIGLNALKQLKCSGAPCRFEYLICGAGPDLDLLRAQVEESGLEEDVKFLGWLESAAITEVLRKAHILLHPARREPYGVAILEAMVNGLVVIGSESTCAVQDRIVDGYNGFRHAVGDVDTIAQQLSILLSDRERICRMGQAARRTALEWPTSRGVEIIKTAFHDSSR